MDKITRAFRCGVILLLALSGSARAADSGVDPRTAKVRDQTDTESQVSGLTATNTDLRFGLDPAEGRGRIVVVTQTYQAAIPLKAISGIVRSGGTTWTVRYQTKDGEATVQGGLEQALLAGNSDFGSFGLPLARLDRLDFTQPGQATDPAKRIAVFDRDGHLRPQNFDALLTLTDGTRLQASQLRRNHVFAQSTTDPAVLPVTPSYAIVCTNYTDFRLLRGETLQTIPFENVKRAEFMSDGQVIVRTTSGAEATMNIPHRLDESVEGFNGTCSKGDFYVPLKFVTSVVFGDEGK